MTYPDRHSSAWGTGDTHPVGDPQPNFWYYGAAKIPEDTQCIPTANGGGISDVISTRRGATPGRPQTQRPVGSSRPQAPARYVQSHEAVRWFISGAPSARLGRWQPLTKTYCSRLNPGRTAVELVIRNAYYLIKYSWPGEKKKISRSKYQFLPL